jgi:beta-N-acetylhexosaminidase
MAPRAFITGLAASRINDQEREFLRDFEPWGLILFARNIDNPQQVLDLTHEFRDIAGRPDAPVLIDQEGGRVQRLRPPLWPSYPPAAAYGALGADNSTAGETMARLGSRLIGHDLAALGINVDCLPVADIPVAGADGVIGDRAYGETVEEVVPLARAAAEGLLDDGVLPVLKHIPGHGRANADSHLRLPVVTADRETLERTDFRAFQELADLPIAMTAHVVFTAYDARLPATTSRTMIDQVIRGFIGFDGLLMSDDVSMQALSGSLGERTAAALAAGCDLALHCNGHFGEMQAVAAEAPVLSGSALRRADAALARLQPPAPFDEPAARTAFAQAMSATTNVRTA